MYSERDDLATGLPHSEIHGSKIARISPRLIATCYVLHRLSVPRHPPNALIALDPKRSFRRMTASALSAFQSLILTNYRPHCPDTDGVAKGTKTLRRIGKFQSSSEF